jgi:hypothetical protein
VDPLTDKSILKWYNNFIEKGCICDQRKGHSGRPSVPELIASEKPFCAGARSQRAELIQSYTSRKARHARSYTNAYGKLDHAVYAAESLVRARLSHRCLPSSRRGAHRVYVIPTDTT